MPIRGIGALDFWPCVSLARELNGVRNNTAVVTNRVAGATYAPSRNSPTNDFLADRRQRISPVRRERKQRAHNIPWRFLSGEDGRVDRWSAKSGGWRTTLRSHPDVLLERAGIDLTGTTVVPCVLNSLPFSVPGAVDGVYVTDMSALTRFISGYLHVISPHRVRPFPTGRRSSPSGKGMSRHRRISSPTVRGAVPG